MNDLNTMNKPIEEIFMDYIGGPVKDLPNLELSIGPSSVGIEALEELDAGMASVLGRLDGRVTEIEPGASVELAAIDASVVRVAESRLGSIVALRAAIVQRSSGFRVWVLGPFLRHIKSVSSTSPGVVHEVKEELRLFERLAQLWAVSNIRCGVFLFDGPLVSRADRQSLILERVLETAESCGGVVLGFSKESVLVPDGVAAPSSVDGVKPPFVRDLTESTRLMWSSLRCLGDVFLAKLSNCLHYFRVDGYPPRRGLEALSSLITSDALVCGYPEALVLAHAYATFSWLDVVAVRRALTDKIESTTSCIYSPRFSVLTPFENRRHENTA